MKNKSIIFIALCAILSSCSSEYTYDVRVFNNSGSTIKVDFKSKTHVDGPIQNSIFLEDGDSELIISTKNLDKDLPNICDTVAQYVRAADVMRGMPSKLEWCDPSIKLEAVDIEQFQYLIEYKKEHFTR